MNAIVSAVPAAAAKPPGSRPSFWPPSGTIVILCREQIAGHSSPIFGRTFLHVLTLLQDDDDDDPQHQEAPKPIGEPSRGA